MRPTDFQNMVLWSIVGPGVLLLSLVVGAAVAGYVGGPPDSWLTGVGVALYYSAFFGAFLVAHAFALFGAIGLVAFPWLSIQRKVSSLAVCALAVLLAVPVFAEVYFNANVFQ